MLRLPKLTDYAVVVLAVLARNEDRILTAGAIAAQAGLALPTVAKILKKMAKMSIVSAQRGTHGGYRLGRAAAAITMADIVAAMDGPIALTACVDGQQGHCSVERCCALRGHWNQINRAIRGTLEGVSLADMTSHPPQPFAAPHPVEIRQQVT